MPVLKKLSLLILMLVLIQRTQKPHPTRKFLALGFVELLLTVSTIEHYKIHGAKPPSENLQSEQTKVQIESECPSSIEQAKQRTDWNLWKAAAQGEIDAHQTNNTYSLLAPSPGQRVLPTRRVFNVKRGASGEIIKHKPRWVCKGFCEEYGVDYDETFASVVRSTVAKALLALGPQHDYEIE